MISTHQETGLCFQSIVESLYPYSSSSIEFLFVDFDCLLFNQTIISYTYRPTLRCLYCRLICIIGRLASTGQIKKFSRCVNYLYKLHSTHTKQDRTDIIVVAYPPSIIVIFYYYLFNDLPRAQLVNNIFISLQLMIIKGYKFMLCVQEIFNL